MLPHCLREPVYLFICLCMGFGAKPQDGSQGRQPPISRQGRRACLHKEYAGSILNKANTATPLREGRGWVRKTPTVILTQLKSKTKSAPTLSAGADVFMRTKTTVPYVGIIQIRFKGRNCNSLSARSRAPLLYRC